MTKPRQTQPDDRLNAKISELRELLLNAKDLGEISDYFYNVLVPDDVFISAGARSSNARLFTVLQAVLEKVAPEGKLGTPLLLRLDEQSLCHGYATWGPGHVVFFYFEQLDRGFCCFCRNLSSSEVSYMRFSLTNVPGVAGWGAWQSFNRNTGVA
jgi:hypothetical protein